MLDKASARICGCLRHRSHPPEPQQDVNALTDKANPANAAKRQVGKAREAAFGVKVMGSANDATSHASSTGSLHRRGLDQRNTRRCHSRTRGNPLAAGLIVLGADLRVGSTLPASQKETEAAAAVKGMALDPEGARAGALESVKSTATDAAAAAAAKDAVQSSAQEGNRSSVVAKGTPCRTHELSCQAAGHSAPTAHALTALKARAVSRVDPKPRHSKSDLHRDPQFLAVEVGPVAKPNRHRRFGPQPRRLVALHAVAARRSP